jgi:hypothetical protein
MLLTSLAPVPICGAPTPLTVLTERMHANPRETWERSRVSK